MSKSALSKTYSAGPPAESTGTLSAYNAPLAVLDARAIASRLAKSPDPAIAGEAGRIFDLLSQAIRDMAGVDLGEPAIIAQAAAAIEGRK